MAISLVTSLGQGLANGGNGGTTSSIDTTGATLLVVCISTYTPGGAPTFSDSKSNTWTALTPQTGSNEKEQMYYCASPVVGSGHTFTVGTGPAYPVITVLAFSGTLAASPLDQQGGNSSGGASTLATTSITPSVDNCVVVVGWASGDNASSLSIDGSYTIQQVVYNSGGANVCGAIAYNIQTTATATNRTWTQGAIIDCATTIASFKPAVAGSGGRNLGLLGVG